MSSISELILILAVFSILFISIILVIVYGSQAFQQFNLITDQLNVTFNQIILSFSSITDSVLASLSSFGRTATKLFISIGADVGDTFFSLNDYLKNQLSSTITTAGSTI